MTSTTTLTVLPLPEDWMPPADWERREIPSEPNREPGYEGGVTYVLDVTKRELVAVPVADYTSESDLGEYLSWEHVRKGVVPARMKLGVLALRFHPEFANGKSVNGILEEVLPLAQDVVDTLVPVAGTSTFDWSAAADMATARIRHVIERTPYRGTEHDFPFRYGAYRLEAKTFFTACHDLVQPQWAELGDDRLDGVLSDLHRVCHEVSQLPENFNRLVGLTTTGPLPDHAHGPTTEFHLVGVRAWLYDLRKARAGDMTPVDAARWDGIAAYAVRVRDDSTSADLDRIAQQVTTRRTPSRS